MMDKFLLICMGGDTMISLTKRSRVGLLLIIIIIGAMTIPSVVNAGTVNSLSDPNININWDARYEKTGFVYDGTEQSLKIINAEEVYSSISEAVDKDANNQPDAFDRSKINFKVIINDSDPNEINDIDITDTMSIKVGTNAGDSVKINFLRVYYGDTRPLDARLDRTYTIIQRPLDIIPQEISYMADGQMKSPTTYQIVGGTSLAPNHYIESIQYGSYGSKAGLYDAFVTNVVIKDQNNIDVTSNYKLNFYPNNLIIENNGTLADNGGGSSAQPNDDELATSSSRQSAVVTRSTSSNNNSELATTTDGTETDNVTTIEDNKVALDSGSGLSNAMNSVKGEANMSLALALFVAIFAVIAVIVIAAMNLYRRNKIRKGEYYN